MRDTFTPFLSDTVLATRGRRWRLLFGVVLAVLATVAFLVPPAAVGDSAAADEWPWEVLPGEDSDLFPLVGEIEFRGTDGQRIDDVVQPVGVDPELGVAVFVDDGSNSPARHVFLVDTQTLEYTVIPDPGDEHVVDKDHAFVDAANHRLIMIGSEEGEAPGETVGEEETGFCEGAVPGTGLVYGTYCQEAAPRGQTWKVTIIDLQGGAEPATRELDLRELDLPDDEAYEVALPFDYHAPTDNLYLATQTVGSAADNDSNLRGGLPKRAELHEVSMAALLDSDPADAVTPTWSYTLGGNCPMVTNRGGGVLARSRQADFVYIACRGGVLGVHGAARVDLRSGAGPSDTSNFRTTVAPFVGNISNGSATADRSHDLMFLQVNSPDARLFVYDAYRRAWTGGIELLTGGNKIPTFSNPETARIYAFAKQGGLQVTEAGWPAVPNSVGRDSSHDIGIEKIGTFIDLPVFDPSTRRMFITATVMCVEEAADGSCTQREVDEAGPHVRVFEDRLPPRRAPAIHPDYDARTADLPEEPGVATSTATANAKAFGARHLWVGGTINAANPNKSVTNVTDDVVRSAPVGPGSRDTIRGQVIGANLSRISTPTVGALATGLHIADEQTPKDLQDNSDVQCAPSRVASRMQQQADCLSDEWQSDEPGEQERELHRRWDGSSWPDEFPEEMRGRSAYCDDFGGDPSEDAKPGSAVACDSAVPQVSAGALFSPSQGDAAADGETPGVHVGYAESSTDIRADEALGMVATATAVARDVDLFGQVSIGEVRTEATAMAHGRPGTASTELVREYRQVRIGDFACGWQDGNPCDLYEVARQINEQLGPRVVARVPAQDTFLDPDSGDEPDAQTGAARVSNGTPGGAKALVTLDPYAYQNGRTISNDTRSELPGLQITVYHDNSRTSRQILQLAAVELDATYLISPAATWDAPDWGSGEGTGGDDGLPDPTGVGGAATRSIVPPPPFAHLSQDPPTTTSDDNTIPTSEVGEAGSGVGFDGDDGALSQGEAPSLGTADGPAMGTGDGVPAPEIASDSSGGQPVAAQDTQGGASAPGGLVLTRQRMGQTVPLAVLWVLAALPFYLAVRRRRLTASAPRT